MLLQANSQYYTPPLALLFLFLILNALLLCFFPWLIFEHTSVLIHSNMHCFEFFPL